jgi:21S rRNA (uridine2791-2'-O)-methyltransferase
VKAFLKDPERGRPRRQLVVSSRLDGEDSPVTKAEVEGLDQSYIDLERKAGMDASEDNDKRDREERDGMVVDVVLSDMSEPWEQTTGFWNKSLSDPYFRMMNTSGVSFRDHAGSMVSDFPFSLVQSSVPLLFLFNLAMLHSLQEKTHDKN